MLGRCPLRLIWHGRHCQLQCYGPCKSRLSYTDKSFNDTDEVLQLRQSDEQFEVYFLTVVPQFKVRERYKFDEVVQQVRSPLHPSSCRSMLMSSTCHCHCVLCGLKCICCLHVAVQAAAAHPWLLLRALMHVRCSLQRSLLIVAMRMRMNPTLWNAAEAARFAARQAASPCALPKSWRCRRDHPVGPQPCW